VQGLAIETAKTTHEVPRSGTGVPEGQPREVHAPSAPPRIDIRALLGGGREAIMLHGEQEYRLRITRNGKLILTK
jgi:hemin uptake protein HemP